jgi:localization factor PodJL
LLLAIGACRPQTHTSAAPIAAAPEAARAEAPVTPGAYDSLQDAAHAGDPVARYELALGRLQAGETADAIALLRRAATSGLAMAQYKLAHLYAAGDGVEADAAEARQWTERAAAAGNCRAMHDLGVYLARGEGAPMDAGAAFRWFRQAAEFNVADSQYNLGLFYEQGLSVGRDGREALFWFMLAAAQGDEAAAAKSEALQHRLTLADIEYARARAHAFRPRTPDAIANGMFGRRAWAAQTP